MEITACPCSWIAHLWTHIWDEFIQDVRSTPSTPGEDASYAVHNSLPRRFVPEKLKPLAPVVTRTVQSWQHNKAIRISFPHSNTAHFWEAKQFTRQFDLTVINISWFLCEIFFFIAPKRLHPRATGEFFLPQSVQTSPGIHLSTYSTGSSTFSPDINDQHLRLTTLFRLMSSIRRCGATHRLVTWDFIKHRGKFNFLWEYSLIILRLCAWEGITHIFPNRLFTREFDKLWRD